MLLHRFRLLTVGLLALSLVFGSAVVAVAAPALEKEEKKEDPKKGQEEKKEKKDNKKTNPVFPPELEELMKRLGGGGDIKPADLEKMIEEIQKAFDDLQKQLPGGALPGLPGGALPGFPGGVLPVFPGGILPNRVGLDKIREETRMGVRLEVPNDTLIDQLDLPKGQGQVLSKILDESAAAKAGIKPNDILLELNGKPVSSDPKEFAKQLDAIKADAKIDAVVLRKGKKETIKELTLPEAKPEAKPAKPRPRINPLPAPGGIRIIGGIGRVGPGGNTIITQTNDGFTATQTAGKVTITLTGNVEKGKTVIEGIKVEDNGTVTNYEKLEAVPEIYKEKIQRLVEAVEKGKGEN